MLPDNFLLNGDTQIKFREVGAIFDSDKFRCTFNPSFIPRSNILRFSLKQLSPESIHSKVHQYDKFSVKLYFEDFCNGDPKAGRPPCRSHLTEIEDLCQRCKVVLRDEIENWKEARLVVQKRKNHS